MPAQIISGKEAAAAWREETATRVGDLKKAGVEVGLATVLVGDDPASHVYVGGKHKAAAAVGMASFDHHLAADSRQEEVEGLVDRLNADPAVTGMIVQLPLPEGLDGEAAVERIDPAKDADGLHPANLGKLVLSRPVVAPATPAGIMRLLAHYQVDVAGKTAVVIGRSFLVGRPLALLLGQKGTDATVTQAHSRTPDLAVFARTADILVVAIGRPEFVTAEFVKEGAVVVDVGIHRTEAGLVGDVAFDDVAEMAEMITPVPGGVGPMTVAGLLANTVTLAQRRVG